MIVTRPSSLRANSPKHAGRSKQSRELCGARRRTSAMGLYQCLLSESQIEKAPFASQEEEYRRVLRGMRPPVRIASYAACGFRVILPDCSLLVWIRLGTRASIPGPFIFAVHLQTTTNTLTAIAEEKEKIKKMGKLPKTSCRFFHFLQVRHTAPRR